MSTKTVAERYLELIRRRRFLEIPELYAEDGIADHPMGVREPRRLEGREVVRGYYAGGGPVHWPEFRVHEVVLHEGADPEVAILEYTISGVSEEGNAYSGRSIQVIRVRDERIVSTTEYHDHLRRFASANNLSELVELLTD